MVFKINKKDKEILNENSKLKEVKKYGKYGFLIFD